MKIATNTPLSFTPQNDNQFFYLGDQSTDVDLIILMLKKNWGAGSITEIKAVRYWLSQYPKEIPCYIIGCESRTPNKDLKKYISKERDDAIKELCDEVLSRSKSIGVRGEITYLHLTEMLGYEESKVDIIYDTQDNDNLDKINTFLEKNNCPLKLYNKDILAFQTRPNVFYERSITFNKDIIISAPKISVSDSTAKLTADILIDGETKTLWCETQKEYQQFLLYERADAFITIILPLAMRTGKNIICESPVTEQLLHNLNEVFIPNLCNNDSRLFRTKITAPIDSTFLICGNAVATGMSCGVDSFYTTSLYLTSQYKSMNLTHLYTGNYAYGNESEVYNRAQSTADDLNLPLIKTTTNINEELKLPHLPTHFYKTIFGVLALKKLFKIYYYSSAGDFSKFGLKYSGTRDVAELEPLTLYCFTTSDFQLITGGAKNNRLEKTRGIIDFKAAQNHLNVCLYPEKTINCGKCGKCMRTLLTIDMMESLDLFANVFDIEEYHNNRIDFFIYLVQQKNHYMLSDVYKHFLKTEPVLIKQAEELFIAGKPPALPWD